MAFNKPIELHTIIGEIVDSIRKSAAITNVATDGVNYRYTSSNSLSKNEYISITDDTDTYTNLKIIEANNTSFVISANYPNAITYKANAPYYMHEKEKKASEILTEKSNSKGQAVSLQKYPLILLKHPYTDTRNSRDIDFISSFEIYIIYNTKESYRAGDRYDNILDPILLPIYQDFINAMADSNYILENNPWFIEHDKTDLLYIDVNPFPDKMDGITLEFTDIDININRDCTPIDTYEFVLTMSSDNESQGLTLPATGANIYKDGQIITVYPVPKTGYEWLKWQLNGVDSSVENPTITMDSNQTAKAFYKERYASFMKIFGFAPELIGSDYVYPDQINNNDAIVHGSNYMTYDATNSEFTQIEPIYIEDGDVLEFWCRNDDISRFNFIVGGDGGFPQIRLNNNSNQLRVNLGSGYTFTIDDTTIWNKYKILFDLSNTRVGLSINDETYTYSLPLTIGTLVPVEYFARLTSSYATISLCNVSLKNSSGVNKIHYPLSEGNWIPNNIIAANNICLTNSGEWGNDINLPAINVVNGCTLENTHYDILIGAGQSNEIISFGAHGDSAFTGDYLKRQKHYYGYNVNGAANVGLKPLNADEISMNGASEVSSGMRITEAGRKVIFIKSAWGGTDLANDWQPSGTAYAALVSIYNDITSQLDALGITYTTKHFLFNQGDNDATDATKIANWPTNFDTMWAGLLAEGIVNSNTRINIPYLSGDNYTYQDEFNEAVDTVIANKGGYAIPTSDIIKGSDGVHYGTEGAIELGNRRAADYLAQPYTEIETSQKLIIPALDDGLTDANGNTITNPADDGFSDADSVIDFADTIQMNDYLTLNGITRTNQTFADIIAYITGLTLIRDLKNNTQINNLEFKE